MEISIPTNNAYSAMGHGRSDYDAFYGVTEEMNFLSWHCHDFYELYIHLQGAEYYSVDNNTYRLKPNQLLIIPPFRMHGLMMNKKLTRYERAFIYLSPSFMKYLGCGQVDIEQMISEFTGSGRFVFDMDEEQARTCAEHINAVHLNGENHQPWDRFTDLSHLLPAVRIMIEAMHSSAASMPTIPANPLMSEILGYIEEHYAEAITLKSLSDQFNISQSSLSHQFLRYTHHSVYEYILYKRIMMAKYRLIQNETPGEAAFQCGFGDYSNFLRAFKKITGLTPSEYKQQVRL